MKKRDSATCEIENQKEHKKGRKKKTPHNQKEAASLYTQTHNMEDRELRGKKMGSSVSLSSGYTLRFWKENEIFFLVILIEIESFFLSSSCSFIRQFWLDCSRMAAGLGRFRRTRWSHLWSCGRQFRRSRPLPQPELSDPIPRTPHSLPAELTQKTKMNISVWPFKIHGYTARHGLTDSWSAFSRYASTR